MILVTFLPHTEFTLSNCLEQSAVVWTLSLSLENIQELERFQRNSVRIIDKNFTSYEKSLKKLNLISLLERRNILSLKFAKKCISHPKMKENFPLNNTYNKGMDTRDKEKYFVTHANTERFRNSAIPFMQRLLNIDHKKHNISGRGAD